MAPESPGNLVVLDLEWKDSRLECQVERYDPTPSADFLYVSWNAMDCPENYVPIGNGVAFVWVPAHYNHRRYRAKVDVTHHGFEWIDSVFGQGLMLILILPLDHVYVFSSPHDSSRTPINFKSTKDGRIALYWWIDSKQSRVEVLWNMRVIPGMDAEVLSRSLNEQAKQLKPANAYPVHIDSPGRTAAPSDKPQAIVEPPLWHRDVAISVERGVEVEYVGRVIDSKTQTPVRGAKVSLGIQGVPPIVYTDSEGIYRFPLILKTERVTGRIHIESEGYNSYDRNIVLSVAATHLDDIRLVPVPASLVEHHSTGDAANQQFQPSRSWLAWGDHPIVVAILLITAIIGAIGVLVQLINREPPEGQTPNAASNQATVVSTAMATTVAPTPTPELTFDGATWQGEFYLNEDLSGEPRIKREDTAINFVWDGEAPSQGIPFEHWSARWTTNLCLEEGPVLFYVKYDDGLRLSIDGKVVLDAWNGPADEEWINYTVSGCTQILVEYRQLTGGSTMKFGWSQP